MVKRDPPIAVSANVPLLSARMEDLSEEMMNHVKFDDAMEQMLTDPTQVPVNGLQGAITEVPGVSLKVACFRMCVVKKSDRNCNLMSVGLVSGSTHEGQMHTNPMVCPKIRNSVQQSHVPVSNLCS